MSRRAGPGGRKAAKAPPRKAARTARPRRGVNYRKKVLNRRARGAGLVRRLGEAVGTIFLAGILLGALGIALWGAHRSYAESGYLILRRIAVAGNQVVDHDTLSALARVELGTKLLEVPIDSVRERIEAHPWIRAAEVSRRFPAGLRIRVEEEAPVAALYDRGWWGVTAEGRRIPGLSLGSFDLPVLETWQGGDLAGLARFLAAARRERPAVYALFSQVRPLGREGTEIVLRSGGARVRLPAGKRAETALVFLERLMERHAGDLDGGRTVDMRVDGYAYIR